MSKYINENKELKKLYEDFFDEIEQDDDVITTDIDDEFNESGEYNFTLLVTMISIPASVRKDIDIFYKYMEKVQNRLCYILDNSTFIQNRSKLIFMLAPQTTGYTWFRAKKRTMEVDRYNVHWVTTARNEQSPSKEASKVGILVDIKCNLRNANELIQFLKLFSEHFKRMMENVLGNAKFWSLDFYKSNYDYEQHGSFRSLFTISNTTIDNILLKKDNKQTINALKKIQRLTSNQMDNKKYSEITEYFSQKAPNALSVQSLDIIKHLGMKAKEVFAYEDEHTLFIDIPKTMRYKCFINRYTIEGLKNMLKTGNINYLLITCNGELSIEIYGDTPEYFNEFSNYFFSSINKLTILVHMYVCKYSKNTNIVDPIDLQRFYINEFVMKEKMPDPRPNYRRERIPPVFKFNRSGYPKNYKFFEYEYDSRKKIDVTDVYKKKYNLP